MSIFDFIEPTMKQMCLFMDLLEDENICDLGKLQIMLENDMVNVNKKNIDTYNGFTIFTYTWVNLLYK